MINKSLRDILGEWPHSLRFHTQNMSPLFIVYTYQLLGGIVGGFAGAALSGFSGNERAITLGGVLGLLGGTLFGYYRVNK